MSFIDLDELKQDAEDEGIVPHPLKDVLSASKKTAYVQGIIFAGFVDDERLQQAEEKFARTRALSLDMTEAEFKDSLEVVKSLSDAKARSAFLKEVLGEFKDDRTTSFYFVSDLALTMVSDNDLTPDAVSFLESVYSLLNLSSSDVKFLAEYRVYLAPGRMADAGALVHKAKQEDFDLPEKFVQFFTPNLNPISLNGGVCQSRTLYICSSKFQLDEELIIPKDTTLVMKDAEIFFGKSGKLTISGYKIEITNCRFNVSSKTAISDTAPSVPYFIVGKDLDSFKLTGCSFDGAMERGAVATDGALTTKDCIFCNLKSDSPIINVKGQLVCTLSEFRNLQSTKSIISANEHLSVMICLFELCRGESLWSMIKNTLFVATFNMFDRCDTKGFTIDCSENKRGSINPFPFRCCCFSSVHGKALYDNGIYWLTGDLCGLSGSFINGNIYGDEAAKIFEMICKEMFVEKMFKGKDVTKETLEENLKNKLEEITKDKSKNYSNDVLECLTTMEMGLKHGLD